MAKKSVYVPLAACTLLLLVICVFSPFSAVALLPVICAFCYYLGLLFAFWLPAAVALPFLGASILVSGVNPLVIGFAAIMCLLCLPLALKNRLSVLWQIAITVIAAIVVGFAVLSIFALCYGSTLSEAIQKSLARLTADPVYSFFAQRHYGKLKSDKLGHEPLAKSDSGYIAEAAYEYSLSVYRELDGTLLWYVSGFCEFTGGIAVLGGYAVYGSTQHGKTEIKNVRLGKEYLFAAVLPALAFMFFYFYAPMRPAVMAITNAFITLPGVMCAITLLWHTANRFKKKAKVAAIIVFWIIMATSAVFYEWGMLVLGFLGLGDIILNMRRLLDWALE